MRVVAALGGNALSPAGGDGSVEEMRASLASSQLFLRLSIIC